VVVPEGVALRASGLIHGPYLYLVNDIQSILTVYDAATGKVIHTRMSGFTRSGRVSRIAVAVGDKLFFTNDVVRRFVVQAGPGLKLLHVNRSERPHPRLARARRWRVVLADG
jgi:hypothetical protein